MEITAMDADPYLLDRSRMSFSKVHSDRL
jgi:hypothetical protein